MTYRPSMISYDKCIGWDHFQYVALDNWCKLDQTVGLFVFSNLFALRNVKGMRVSIVAPAYLKGKDRPWVPISLWFGCSDSSVDLNIAIANRIKQWQQLVWGRLPYVQPSTFYLFRWDRIQMLTRGGRRMAEVHRRVFVSRYRFKENH